MEILNSYEMYTNNGFTDAIYAALIIVTLFALIVFIGSLIENDLGTGIVTFIIGGTAAVGLFLMSDYVFEEHTEYEVLVEDYNEVIEQGFEIVEQRGEIIVVKEAE